MSSHSLIAILANYFDDRSEDNFLALYHAITVIPFFKIVFSQLNNHFNRAIEFFRDVKLLTLPARVILMK